MKKEDAVARTKYTAYLWACMLPLMAMIYCIAGGVRDGVVEMWFVSLSLITLFMWALPLSQLEGTE